MKSVVLGTVGIAGLVLSAGAAPANKAALDERIARLKEIQDGSCDRPADSLTCRTEAVYWLARSGNEYVIPAVVEVLKNDPYTSARVEAVKALEHIGGAKAIDHLKSALKADLSPVVRIYAAKSLGNLGDRSPEVLSALYNASQGKGRETWSAKGFYTPNPNRDKAQEEKGVMDNLQIQALDIVSKVNTAEARKILDTQAKSPNLTIQEAAKRFQVRPINPAGR